MAGKGKGGKPARGRNSKAKSLPPAAAKESAGDNDSRHSENDGVTSGSESEASKTTPSEHSDSESSKGSDSSGGERTKRTIKRPKPYEPEGDDKREKSRTSKPPAPGVGSPLREGHKSLLADASKKGKAARVFDASHDFPSESESSDEVDKERPRKRRKRDVIDYAKVGRHEFQLM